MATRSFWSLLNANLAAQASALYPSLTGSQYLINPVHLWARICSIAAGSLCIVWAIVTLYANNPLAYLIYWQVNQLFLWLLRQASIFVAVFSPHKTAYPDQNISWSNFHETYFDYKKRTAWAYRSCFSALEIEVLYQPTREIGLDGLAGGTKTNCLSRVIAAALKVYIWGSFRAPLAKANNQHVYGPGARLQMQELRETSWHQNLCPTNVHSLKEFYTGI